MEERSHRTAEPRIPDAVRIAVNHVSVSARERVRPEAFLDALAGRDAQADAMAAVYAYLNEADPAELAELVASKATDFPTLARIAARVLPAFHPNGVHLEQFTA